MEKAILRTPVSLLSSPTVRGFGATKREYPRAGRGQGVRSRVFLERFDFQVVDKGRHNNDARDFGPCLLRKRRLWWEMSSPLMDL
jgi:hypothetical protein